MSEDCWTSCYSIEGWKVVGYLDWLMDLYDFFSVSRDVIWICNFGSSSTLTSSQVRLIWVFVLTYAWQLQSPLLPSQSAAASAYSHSKSTCASPLSSPVPISQCLLIPSDFSWRIVLRSCLWSPLSLIWILWFLFFYRFSTWFFFFHLSTHFQSSLIPSSL